MATYAYMSGRQKWKRPQAMLWSDNPGTLVLSDPADPLSPTVYVPEGIESYANFYGIPEDELSDQFLILSDHNRGEISVSTQRIEKKQRMINGTMRSTHIADKITISTSWTMLPSRQARVRPMFNVNTGEPFFPASEIGYTADLGAGGAEMLKWYQDHTGPFWVFLSYDKFINYGTNVPAYQYLDRYSQVVQMYISNFDYSVVKRGGPTPVAGSPYDFGYDMWNVNVTLEEV